MKLENLDSGYAIVLYKNYIRYKKKAFWERIIDNLEEAKYNASSLSKVDGINYAVYSVKEGKLVY